VILEGLLTTTNDDGGVNVAPMGPVVDASMQRIELRPYRTSRSLVNLLRTGGGVFHVTDDVLLLARAAIGRVEPTPALLPLRQVGKRAPQADRVEPTPGGEGAILADACRWYALRVRSSDTREVRARIVCDVVDRGRIRDFFGFCRAKHAVIEAAILATRVEFLPADQIRDQWPRLAELVAKTGGPQERQAWAILTDFVEGALSNGPK